MLPKSANHCGIQPLSHLLEKRKADFELIKCVCIVVYLFKLTKFEDNAFAIAKSLVLKYVSCPKYFFFKHQDVFNVLLLWVIYKTTMLKKNKIYRAVL
jgi:hypothetical protein